MSTPRKTRKKPLRKETKLMGFKRKISELLPGYTQDLDLILLGISLGFVAVGVLWYWPMSWVGGIALVALTVKEAINGRV